MEVRVYGSGTATFWWKVSSEYGDYLEFWLDGVRRDRIDGQVDWQQKSYQIDGNEPHSLLWQYIKDGSGSENDDRGWVDYLQWDGATQAPTPDWQTLSYVYDASGRRIEKKYDGNTQLKYIYDGDHCIAEYNGAGVLQRKYIYGPGVDQPICMLEGAATSYYHFDALGSVIALTDANGDVEQEYEYSVWGQVGASDPNHSNRFMFTGREFDKETGLYYYRARYYHPEIGRFLQTDPIAYGAGMNMYSYCWNRPPNYIDPWGLDPTFVSSPTQAVSSAIYDTNSGNWYWLGPGWDVQSIADWWSGDETVLEHKVGDITIYVRIAGGSVPIPGAGSNASTTNPEGEQPGEVGLVDKSLVPALEMLVYSGICDINDYNTKIKKGWGLRGVELVTSTGIPFTYELPLTWPWDKLPSPGRTRTTIFETMLDTVIGYLLVGTGMVPTPMLAGATPTGSSADTQVAAINRARASAQHMYFWAEFWRRHLGSKEWDTGRFPLPQPFVPPSLWPSD